MKDIFLTAEEVRAALRLQLERDGLTHDQLAARLGVTQGYLSKVLAGDCNPGAKLLIALGLRKDVRYVDAMDAARLANGEALKCEPTDRRVFDDDIVVERCDCLNYCGDDPQLKTGKVRKCADYAANNPQRCPLCQGSGYVAAHVAEAWELNGSNPNPPECDPRA